ncbi:hypothetical protein V495_05686 [Pseudogymnoascus sp. VKM F-4514 (FW-929)]|nr:hypothetical protein V495_05686 [Pseudogymnoascus sp. VKM F-4514 (FW-929)]KFY59273.1 hypothetical protein V497_04394 [Pseudogymnoascus sp. VKM F-4516 (FW-969)]
MQFTAVLLGFSALLTTVLANPVAVASPLTERACAYDDCAACEDYCWNDIPCAPDHNCGINQAGCLILCIETGCCDA